MLRRIGLATAAFLLAASMTAGSARATEAGVVRSKVSAAIVARHAKYAAAVGKGDVEAIGKLIALDGTLYPPNAPKVSGRESGVVFWRATLEVVKGLDITTQEVRAAGDFAIETGDYIALGAEKAELDRGKYLTVWQMTNEGWVISSDIWNSSLAPK